MKKLISILMLISTVCFAEIKQSGWTTTTNAATARTALGCPAGSFSNAVTLIIAGSSNLSISATTNAGGATTVTITDLSSVIFVTNRYDTVSDTSYINGDHITNLNVGASTSSNPSALTISYTTNGVGAVSMIFTPVIAAATGTNIIGTLASGNTNALIILVTTNFDGSLMETFLPLNTNLVSTVLSGNTNWIRVSYATNQNGSIVATVTPLNTNFVSSVSSVNTNTLTVSATTNASGSISESFTAIVTNVNGSQLSDTLPDNVTLSWDGSSPRRLGVSNSGIFTNNLNPLDFYWPMSGGGAGLVKLNFNSTLFITNSTGLILNYDKNLLSTNGNGLIVKYDTTLLTNSTGLGLNYNTNTFTNSSGGLDLSRKSFSFRIPTTGSASFSYSTITNAHNLSTPPSFVRVVLVCTNAEFGYKTNDEVDLPSAQIVDFTAASPPGNAPNSTVLFAQITCGFTNIHLSVVNDFYDTSPTSSSPTYRIMPRTNFGTYSIMNPTNWNFKIYYQQ